MIDLTVGNGGFDSDAEDSFNDIFEQLSLEDEDNIKRLERLSILQELRDGPPYAASPIFKAKHAARVQADQAEYMPEYDKVIAEADDDTPFPPDWHERKRFRVPVRSIRAESELSVPASGAASDIYSRYEPTPDTAEASMSIISPTAPTFRPTSSITSPTSPQLTIPAAPVAPQVLNVVTGTFVESAWLSPVESLSSPVGFWKPDAFQFRPRPQSPRYNVSARPPRLSKAIPIKAPSKGTNNTATQARRLSTGSRRTSMSDASSATDMSKNSALTTTKKLSTSQSVKHRDNAKTLRQSSEKSFVSSTSKKDQTDMTSTQNVRLSPQDTVGAVANHGSAVAQISQTPLAASQNGLVAPLLKQSRRRTPSVSSSSEDNLLSDSDNGTGLVANQIRSTSRQSMSPVPGTTAATTRPIQESIPESRSADQPSSGTIQVGSTVAHSKRPTDLTATGRPMMSLPNRRRGDNGSVTSSAKPTQRPTLNNSSAALTSPSASALGTGAAAASSAMNRSVSRFPAAPERQSSPYTEVSDHTIRGLDDRPPPPSERGIKTVDPTRGRLLFIFKIVRDQKQHEIPLYELDDPELTVREIEVSFFPNGSNEKWKDAIIRLYEMKLEANGAMLSRA